MRGTSFNPPFSRGFLTDERKSPRVYKKTDARSRFFGPKKNRAFVHQAKRGRNKKSEKNGRW
jgi:hypothetical protein